MFGQDTISTGPFRYHASQQEERKNKTEIQSNMWISQKARPHGAYKLHYEKRENYKRISHPQPSYSQYLSLKRSFSSQKLSLKETP